jgi:hypothetical protein
MIMHVQLRVVMTVADYDQPSQIIEEVVQALRRETEENKCRVPSRHEGVLKNETGFPIGAYLYERTR